MLVNGSVTVVLNSGLSLRQLCSNLHFLRRLRLEIEAELTKEMNWKTSFGYSKNEIPPAFWQRFPTNGDKLLLSCIVFEKDP